MLKREHLKQAIDVIARRSPEIGYCLDELLGDGTIDILPAEQAVSGSGDFLFLFDDRIQAVRRYSFFNSGTAPIEQQLLARYGEMQKKQAALDTRDPIDFAAIAKAMQFAGAEFVIDYEIDLALEALHLRDGAGENAPRSTRRDACRARLQALKGPHDTAQCHGAQDTAPALFTGVVGNRQPARFVSFPFTRSALIQAAELNLEFFHLRFLIDLLVSGRQDRLFACMTGERLWGLIFLGPRQKAFMRGLEIRYIATAREDPDRPLLQPPRGVGAFLVAGAWLFWKTRCPEAQELVLDSEIGAIGFYKRMGFEQRGNYNYVLKTPGGYLLYHIVVMADGTPELSAALLVEIGDHLGRLVHRIARKTMAEADAEQRKPALRAIRRGLLCQRHAELAKSAMQGLLRERQTLPEAEELIHIATHYGRLRFKAPSKAQALPLPIVFDAVFGEHLKSLIHMEGARRVQAVSDVLNNPAIAGRWKTVALRTASEQQLAWVHTAAHIARIAATEGKPVASLDLDTQTTALSYQVARQAVGSVFALLDEVWNGSQPRGFAFVRPPGHHAEPDRAMGFCLFNNVALGACYLEHVYGLERIMIVDIDAHHGNGIQKAFYDTRTVLYASLHQFPAYPGTGGAGEVGAGDGEGFTVNVPLDKGSQDNDFAQVIHGIIRPIAQAYEPEIILVACGFDLFYQDRLAQMRGTAEGYGLMTHFLKEIADQVCGGKLVYILEGGYSVRGIEECALQTLRELLDISTLDPQRIRRVRAVESRKVPALRKVLEVQKKYWPTLRG
jgi:acetoin utilization deacetylase AcuC-like enzyme